MLLGIDSAFSIVEAISTVIYDSDLNKYRLKWTRMMISTVLCIAGAIGSALYCFDTGFYWLDLVDFYINNYGMVFLGICETAACGWFYSYDLIHEKIGRKSADIYRFGYWFSLVLACILSFSLSTPVTEYSTGRRLLSSDGFMTTDFMTTDIGTTSSMVVFTGGLGKESWIVGFVVGLIGWAVTCGLAYHYRSEEANKLSNGELWWYIMGWENVEVLRGFMNTNGLGKEEWEAGKHTLGGGMNEGMFSEHYLLSVFEWLPCSRHVLESVASLC